MGHISCFTVTIGGNRKLLKLNIYQLFYSPQAIQPTKDPVLTGVKDAPSELGIPAETIPEEAAEVFGLPAQEEAFALEDAPSLQDFLGGDINEDSLLEEVRDAYYDETAGDDGKGLE